MFDYEIISSMVFKKNNFCLKRDWDICFSLKAHESYPLEYSTNPQILVTNPLKCVFLGSLPMYILLILEEIFLPKLALI